MNFTAPEKAVLERFIGECTRQPFDEGLDNIGLRVAEQEETVIRQLEQRGILSVTRKSPDGTYSPRSFCYLTIAGRAETLKLTPAPKQT